MTGWRLRKLALCPDVRGADKTWESRTEELSAVGSRFPLGVLSHFEASTDWPQVLNRRGTRRRPEFLQFAVVGLIATTIISCSPFSPPTKVLLVVSQFEDQWCIVNLYDGIDSRAVICLSTQDRAIEDIEAIAPMVGTCVAARYAQTRWIVESKQTCPGDARPPPTPERRFDIVVLLDESHLPRHETLARFAADLTDAEPPEVYLLDEGVWWDSSVLAIAFQVDERVPRLAIEEFIDTVEAVELVVTIQRDAMVIRP